MVKLILAPSGSLAAPLRLKILNEPRVRLRFSSLIRNQIPRSRRRTTCTTDCYAITSLMNLHGGKLFGLRLCGSPICRDLLLAKLDTLDRGVEFPLAPEFLSDRFKSVFKTLDLTREA